MMLFILYFSVLSVLLCGFIENIGCVQCYNGYCYMISNDSIKYDSLLTECTDGYNVLEIHSPQMQSDIEVVLIGYEFSEFDFYIGLTDLIIEGTFGWKSGTAVSYTNFSPSNSNSKGKDCVFISSSNSWQWFSTPCTRNLNYICFTEGNDTVLETTTSTEPETTSTVAETTFIEPETTTSEPETTTSEPETISTVADTTSIVAETTSTVTETTSTEPETTSTVAETTSTVTETTFTVAETTSTLTETTSTEPETTSTVAETESETTYTEPGTTSTVAETTFTVTETTSTEPETTSILPSTSTLQISNVNTSSIHLQCAFKTITCRCGRSDNETISEKLRTLYSELYNMSISARQFQKNKKLYSRQDHRTSSQTIGYLGAGILVVLTVILLILDISRLCIVKITPVT